jgi:3-phosphoshikimate 1-carboxyvinyltransferase
VTALRLEAPASKSMTQRALVIAALAEGTASVRRALDCDDSRYLVALLRALGLGVTWTADTIEVAPPPPGGGGVGEGGSRLRPPPTPVFCGNAGTAVRFGSCFSLLCDGPLTIDGDERMRTRPIGPLAEALQSLGARVTWLGRPGCPPLRIERRLPLAAEVKVDASVSSQYASGLLLVAPRLPHGLVLELGGDLVSAPYVAMTVAMMRSAGADVRREGERRLAVAPGAYRAGDLEVEPDWSSAAFLMAAARAAAVPIAIDGLVPPERSLQGDAAFAAMMTELDVDRPHAFDLRDTPDLVPPLVAACLFARAPSSIRGVAHARVKESDRLAVLARELRKVGARITEHTDGLDVAPLQLDHTAEAVLDPEDDHRMAMTFGVVGLRVPGLRVGRPECVSKSFPKFWDALATMASRRSHS